VRLVRNHSLSLFFGLLLLASLLGHSIAGHLDYNEEARAHGDPAISYERYLVSSQFGEAVLENWQSEYLQFSLLILATIWLYERGSTESKKLEDIGLESDEQQKVGDHAERRSPRWAKAGGWRFHLYANSLLLVMATIFFASWFGQSVTAWTNYNDEQKDHEQTTVSWLGYLGRADFWEKTFQNWQSEFLAVGTMAVFTIYLRQRGSPESKPVGTPHDQTAAEG
jgi:hypothetical protein